MSNDIRSDTIRGKTSRVAPVVIAVVISVTGIWCAGRAGLSRWAAASGRDRGQRASIERAIQLEPRDPFAYASLGDELLSRNQVNEARMAFERAVALRPGDYELWLKLGDVCTRTVDLRCAHTAYQNAARQAPYYYQPRLKLGHTLIRLGNRDDGMAELRRAVASDPRTLGEMIEFVWREFSGDAKAVSDAIRPETSAARLQLARYFVQQGSTADAANLFCGGTISTEDRLQFLSEVLAARKFMDAYSIWTGTCDQNSEQISKRFGLITDGGFEREISLLEKGFGWRLAGDIPSIQFSLDTNQASSGASSLSITFNGDINLTEPLVTQLVLVEANTRYQLTFVARTDQLVTGAPPVVNVNDANADQRPIIGRSAAFSIGTSAWQTYTIDFETSTQTQAIQIVLMRQGCAESACPIFGRAWVDDFALQKKQTDITERR